MPTVSAIFIYPVKSMRGMACAQARLGATGLEWDRQWMAVDARGTFLSQRTHPRLARIVPEVTADALLLNAPDMPPLRVPLAATGAAVPVRVWKDACSGVEQGAAAHEWLSRVLRQPARLVRVAPNMQRTANREFAGTIPAPITFPDGYPVLVVNAASLQDLNARLGEQLPMERFRPNLVLEGLPAWAEDHIDTLAIGPVTLRLVKPCVRCSIPSLDHLTGDPATDPMPVLRKFRFNNALRGITFGENAVIVSGTGAAVGRGAPCQVSFEAPPGAAAPH
ncbi:MAG: MOSC N-terminal beta barrel domain-containing protein [Steroidobacteraceae bacterium]